MKIAIIGAGVAGLASVRHCLEDGYECVVFEQSGQVGGTWNYTDNIGTDEYGLPVHSSMYQGLRTNLPKELMQFEDFPFEGPKLSFVSQSEVLKYINDYSTHFNLQKYVKFFHHVLEVDPLNEGKWSIKVKDLKTNSTETNVYDSVFICVGNYSVPKIPKFPGIETFTGKTMHCHYFRKPEPFKNKKVLVIGAGPSGVDVARIVAEVAEKVIIVNRSDIKPKVPEQVIVKPEIVKFKESSVEFKDKSEESIDSVIFCTGYKYTYPFLTTNCKIQVEDNWVKFLYKHIVNVEYPTMAFIGVPFRICPFPVICMQVRFFLAFLKGKVKVSKQQMIDEINEHTAKRKKLGCPTHYMHRLGLEQGAYMDDLTDTASIKRVPPVLQKLYAHHHATSRTAQTTYKLISDREFVQIS